MSRDLSKAQSAGLFTQQPQYRRGARNYLNSLMFIVVLDVHKTLLSFPGIASNFLSGLYHNAMQIKY